jgi:hypothetical protein
MMMRRRRRKRKRRRERRRMMHACMYQELGVTPCIDPTGGDSQCVKCRFATQL